MKIQIYLGKLGWRQENRCTYGQLDKQIEYIDTFQPCGVLLKYLKDLFFFIIYCKYYENSRKSFISFIKLISDILFSK